jgi:uncharacterized protein (DUF4415 family)
MTRKPKKAKIEFGKTKGGSRKEKIKTERKSSRRMPSLIDRLFAGVEDDLVFLADQKTETEPRWSRPRKQRISLRVDTEVVDWLKSKGPGYQTRINRILRRLMMEGKRRAGET